MSKSWINRAWATATIVATIGSGASLTACSTTRVAPDAAAVGAVEIAGERTPQIWVVAPVGDEWVVSAAYEGEADPLPQEADQRFASAQEAIEWASAQPAEFGVRVAPDPR